MGFAGSQVISIGGSFSGATASAKLRRRELHQGRAIVSPISSPTSTGRDSNCNGGSVSGEITSPKLVKMVRYHDRTRKSPSSMPRLTGREVRYRGGRLSGRKRSKIDDQRLPQRTGDFLRRRKVEIGVSCHALARSGPSPQEIEPYLDYHHRVAGI